MGAPPDALALRRLCDRAVFRLCTTWIRESSSSPLYKCMEAARASDMLWEKQLSWISQLTPLEIGIDPRHIRDSGECFLGATNALKDFVSSSLNGNGSSTVRTFYLLCYFYLCVTYSFVSNKHHISNEHSLHFKQTDTRSTADCNTRYSWRGSQCSNSQGRRRS